MKKEPARLRVADRASAARAADRQARAAEQDRRLEEELALLPREALVAGWLEAEQRIREERQGRVEAEQRRLEAEQGRVEERQRRVEAEQRRREAEQRRVEERQRRVEAEQRRREAEQRNQGTYYSTIDQVWRGVHRRVGVADSHLFNALKRTRAPRFVGPDGVANCYDETIRKATDPVFVPCLGGEHHHHHHHHQPQSPGTPPPPPPSDASTMNTQQKRDAWPCTVFAVGDAVAAVARLVPARRTKAAAYVDVAVCALALDENSGLPWETIQKALHGAAPAPGRGRVARTGIKHSVANRIRLRGSREYFDQNPCVLIVPVLTLNEVKRWRGQGYQAIVVAGPTPFADDADYRGPFAPIQAVCGAIGLVNEGDVALPGQIHVARTLLSHFVLGLAYSLAHRSGRYSDRMTAEERGELDRCREACLASSASGIVVPERNRAGLPWRVRLVTLRGAADSGNHHVAPDPLLLAVKAAVNWSRRQGQQLLPTPEPDHEEGEIDDLSALEMRRFLDFQRDAARDDLARLVEETPGGFQVAF
jgi:hypothetical protein